MNVCIPKERRDSEFRVGLTTAGVRLLTKAGVTCFVEHEAGVGSGFSDYDYEKAGAQIVYSGEEIYGRADLVIKVARPTDHEFDWMQKGQIVTGFLHLAAGRSNKIETLLTKKITAIGYEIIQDDDGTLPVQIPMSQAGGRMAAQVAATLSQNHFGGKGILLGGLPGVPPAEVIIIGGGTAGAAAARNFLGIGAAVYILDKDLDRLRELDIRYNGQVVTMVSHAFNIQKVCKFADVLVGAVQNPGARAPLLVTREMVKSMRPRSIIMDLAIDQGGCIETSRPTTHSNPTFIEEDIIHYCVPNMAGVLGRTATHVLNNATWPFIQMISQTGLENSLAQSPALERGVYTHQGEIVHPTLQASWEGRR